MSLNLLIVDDDPLFARGAATLGEQQGFDPHVADSIGSARAFMCRTAMDMTVLDLELPDGSGLDLLHEFAPDRYGRIAIATAKPSLASAMGAVRSPAIDYLVKPFDPQRLVDLMAGVSAARAPRAKGALALPGVVTASTSMAAPIHLAQRVAALDVSVFLEGETGTGKEIFARAIHETGGRTGPFVAINCGAVPAGLLASQLFGHERGSFTGAIGRHAGVFEQATGGTLFLDEITEMPIDLQVYLLRALESGAVRRVGATSETATSARIIAASNRPPREAIRSGHLREDLYYRLADFTISLPPLRERGDDVELLARRFVEELNARHGQRYRLAPASSGTLRRHRWGGNVRELRSAVQRAYLLSDSPWITVVPDAERIAKADGCSDSRICFEIGMTWAELERRSLRMALDHCHGDKTAAAKLLGISVRTVHNRLAQVREAATAVAGQAP